MMEYKIEDIQNKGINMLSLFDGISCTRVALERANIPIKNYYASEVDKWAIAVSKKNYPDIIHLGDVKNIGHGTIARLQNKMICEIDLMVGGFPCTDLSIAKKDRQGLQGEKSGLFYEMIRIHREVMPRWFIYENVFSMSQKDKDLITKEIGEIMYPPEEWEIIDD
ncbi:MAG: DNA cytosine methyltransferase [Nanoarchaeota archaeon]